MANRIKETLMRFVFFLSAGISVLAVLLICVFLFANGVPAIREIGVSEFLLGKIWKPSNNLYGIFPMIVGRGCDFGRRADRRFDRGVFGALLPEKGL